MKISQERYIKTSAYEGEDRRKNGIKIRLSIRDWGYLGSIAVAVLFFCFRTSNGVAQNTKIIDEEKNKNKAQEESINNNKQGVAVINERLKPMQDDIREIRNDIKSLLREKKITYIPINRQLAGADE